MYYLAVDIGASSGRHILCEKKDGKLLFQEVYRFENGNIEKDGHKVWNIEKLFTCVIEGLRKCKEIGKIPATMAIDTWGVDFALIDKSGNPLGEVVAYRDDRTHGMDLFVEEKVSFEQMYERAGIQKQIYNTVYQLEAIKRHSPQLLSEASTFLMIPEYLGFLLTGKAVKEYTNATTTGLVNAAEKTWDFNIIDNLGYNREIFGDLNMPGTVVGPLKKEIAAAVGFDICVMLCASHDTASAFLAVPSVGDDSVYISSGTWSLLGVENENPITTRESLRANFTNEGGYNYRFRYLKNIMGLWIIQSVRRNLNNEYSFIKLGELAREARGFKGRINVNDDIFLAPKNMVETVTNAATVKPQNVGELMECIYESLAESYADAISELKELTGKKYLSVNIVGGGSNASYLNELTHEKTGLAVYAGPAEGTAIGNIMVQMIAAGEFSNLQQARDCVRESFEILRY